MNALKLVKFDKNGVLRKQRESMHSELTNIKKIEYRPSMASIMIFNKEGSITPTLEPKPQGTAPSKADLAIPPHQQTHSLKVLPTATAISASIQNRNLLDENETPMRIENASFRFRMLGLNN